TAKGDQPETALPDLDWSEDDGKLTWNLITQIEKPENFKVLFGTKAGEAIISTFLWLQMLNHPQNTSGDSKAKVHRRIAEALIPEQFKDNQKSAEKKIKTKIEGLHRTYKEKVKRIQQTGEGHRDEAGNVYLECYVPAEGPNEETAEKYKNIWDEINTKFPYFARFH
ncbi:hypothetical protein C8J56DRAFT_737782, partial [Mycena floridula]